GAGTLDISSVAAIGVTMTVAQHNGFTTNINANGGDDTITLSSTGTLTADADIKTYVLDNGTNSITLSATSQNVTGGTGADSIRMSDAILNSTGTLDGNGGTDEIRIMDAATVDGTEFGSVSEIETLALGFNASGQSITVGTGAGSAQAAGIVTVDVSAVTSGSTTVNASTYTTGITLIGGSANDTLTGGTVADIIISGAGSDNLTGNDGNDSFRFLSADFTSADTVAGGNGTDEILITDSATVIDTDFANVSTVETLKLSDVAGPQSITVGATASSKALATIDATALTTGHGVSINAQLFSGALTINTGAGNDVIELGTNTQIVNAGGGDDQVSVTQVALASNFDGGTGTDQLIITGGGVSNMSGGSVVGFEEVVIAASGVTLTASSLVGLLITGSGNADIINTGTASGQTVNAGAGADIVTINSAGQTINGEANDDSFNVSNTTIVGTTIDGGSGTDTLVATGGSMDMSLATSITSIEAVNFSVATTLTATSIAGLSIIGSSFGDNITLGGGGQTVDAGGGADTIRGGTGADTLTGGAGADTFVFNTALGTSDTLTDYTAGFDLLYLENGIFTALTSTGTLAAGNFVSGGGATAADANDFILYDTTTGNLYYDADGNGAGAAVQFAHLNGTPALANTDITII
ncbi:MAG: calcium-binding protein, partial [Rhodocyclaceae bacterium]|nr:calcium-binding protein [Rhodocyclaceae bacterium]